MRKINFLLICFLVSTVCVKAQTLPRESSGYIPVENINTLPGQSGYIDRTGRFILRQLFEAAGGFSEGLADVKILGDRWGYIDTAGKMVIEPQFDETTSFTEGLAAVKINCKWGYINKSGKLVIPAQFDLAGKFSEGLALVRVGTRYAYINKTGKFVIKLRPHWHTEKFSGGMARIQTA
ncbi:MAG TPA: WG repeat-containing protein, partial [Blastocatellia bacterium]|nr:WG repeat-containing protein [Blastocatellia bacterium]